MQREIHCEWCLVGRMIQILFCATAGAFWILIALCMENERTVLKLLLRVAVPAMSATLIVSNGIRHGASGCKRFRVVSSFLMLATAVLQLVFLLNILKPMAYYFGRGPAAAVMDLGLTWALATAVIERALQGQEECDRSGNNDLR